MNSFEKKNKLTK